MANYYAVARSNYFKIKDESAFRAWAQSRQLGVWDHEQDETGNAMFGIYSNTPDDDGWPFQIPDEENEDFEDIDLQTELAEHLAEGSIAVLMEVGAEKLSFVNGFAVAINSKGETVRIDLGDIYEAAEHLGKNITKVEG